MSRTALFRMFALGIAVATALTIARAQSGASKRPASLAAAAERQYKVVFVGDLRPSDPGGQALLNDGAKGGWRLVALSGGAMTGYSAVFEK